MDELKTISSKSLRSNNLLFAQLLLNEAQNKNLAISGASDNSSVTSSNADSNSGGSLSKTAREQKLVELLLQPHILHGLLDYIVLSVDFFHDASMRNQNEDQKENQGENGELAKNDPETSGEDTLDGSAEDSPKDGMEESEDEPRAERLLRFILCSAEILLTDLWVISSRIIETSSLMDKLWLVLSLPNLQESSPALAYLVQILSHLMDSNCIELTNFIRRQELLVDTFLNKVDIPILMDFFLKIIQTDKPDSPTGILAVLLRQQMIPKLMDILRPLKSMLNGLLLVDPDLLFKQTSATEFIKALVTISSNPTLAVDLDTNIGPNQLTRELASSKIMSIMLNEIMLCHTDSINGPVPNKHGISNCVSILIELIRKNNSDYDSNCGTYTQNSPSQEGPSEINVQSMYLWLKDLDQNPPGTRDLIYLGDLLKIFSDGLPDLVAIMRSEPEVDSMGKRILGLTKFKLSELVAELLHCSNMILLNSNKIAYLVGVRDEIRSLQTENIQAALSEPIYDDMGGSHMSDVPVVSNITSAIDNISLEPPVHAENANQNNHLAVPGHKSRNSVDNFSYEDTEDEEPSVSSENPFVCEERNKNFRSNPCAGDYFKIQLLDLHMLQTIVELFTEYPWHNFFHNVVFDLIQQVFNGKLNSYNSFLIVELFENCHITELIIEAFRANNDPRPGYMGHFVLVSEEVVKFASLYKPSLISPIIVEALGSKQWEWFVSEVLLKTRELYNVVLGTDPEYSMGEDELLGDEDKFGFDSSTVGYMDMDNDSTYNSRHAIILGDSNNHEEFVGLGHKDEDDDADDDDDDDGDDFEDADDDDGDNNGQHLRRRILDVPIKSMSPNAEFENKDMLYEDFGGHKITFEGDTYLDDFPGSSSSDEESENQLYRVPKHQE